ncbi:hypothetical protein C5E12_02130, partial [Rathayibacter rathayi]
MAINYTSDVLLLECLWIDVDTKFSEFGECLVACCSRLVQLGLGVIAVLQRGLKARIAPQIGIAKTSNLGLPQIYPRQYGGLEFVADGHPSRAEVVLEPVQCAGGPARVRDDGFREVSELVSPAQKSARFRDFQRHRSGQDVPDDLSDHHWVTRSDLVNERRDLLQRLITHILIEQ